MTVVKRRVRRSTGGRWTAKERDLLLRLGSQPDKISWRLIQAIHFPTRTVDAIQKQYSDVRKLQREKDTMSKNNDAGSPSTPSRVSARKRPNSPSTSLTGEPAPKQTKIIEADSDSVSEYEDSDATSDDDDGSIHPDGSRTLRTRPRNPTLTEHQTRRDASGDASKPTRPSQIVRMSLSQGEKGKSALQIADERPEHAIEQSSTQSNPQRTVTPQDVEASVQGPEKSADMSKVPSQKGSIDAKDISSGSGDSTDLLYSMLNNVRAWLTLVENERVQRQLGNLKIQELSRALASEKGKIRHLEHLLKERDDALKQKNDVIEKLNADFQKEKERNARERADSARVARPCSNCTKGEKIIEAFRKLLASEMEAKALEQDQTGPLE